jgi:hypothetical protein
MTDTETPRRWYRPTPGHLVALLFAVEGFLLLSAQFEWFAFGRMKGIPSVLCVAAVAGTIVLLFAWFLLAILFRLRFQYSLRSLMLLTLAASIACSWLAVGAKRAREQRQIVEEIEKLGGRVSFDYECRGVEHPLPYPWTWLCDLLGDDYFAEITWVDYRSTQITDAGLENLKGLTNLTLLWLDNTQITDTGLEHIKRLTNLFELSLANTRITDAGLEHLTGMNEIGILSIENTQISVEGEKKLQEALPNCNIFY